MQNKIDIGTTIDLQDLLQSRLLIQANSGGGKSVLARVIIEQTFGIVPFIVLDIEGEYYTLKEKFGDLLVIGGQHADIPISLKSVKLLPKEIIANRLSVVIDLSDLQMNDRILYAKHFLETMMDLTKEYWINYLVFIEEAHKLCGEQDKQASATAVKDLMSRGRKRGYCGVLLTQRISKLHKDAAAECNNKFIGRTFLDIDLDRSAKELGLSSAADKKIIRELLPGNFYAFGTSIEPHEVHTVKINLPQTKIPKAGVNLDIKPKAPTEKIKAMLVKLNEIETEKPKSVSKLQKSDTIVQETEINSLKLEIGTTREKLFQANKMLEAKDKQIVDFMSRIEQVNKVLSAPMPKFDLSIKIKPEINFPKKPEKVINKIDPKVEKNYVPNATRHKLEKCPLAILQFLASYPEQAFTKVQIAIGSGYSQTSSGFENGISKLHTLDLIIKSWKRIRVNQNNPDLKGYLGDFQPKVYDLNTYMDKLGACERKIYQFLIENSHKKLLPEDIAKVTGYSLTSSGFANAISRLNTLELITKEGRGNDAMISLNPMLFEY